ncbi:MAG: HAD family phosphatase [Solirubrobacterales bacterium]|nr:HAD family phosphatase [Solirubrobacterales bacterium]
MVSDLGGVLTTPLRAAFEGYAEHSGVKLHEFFTALVTLSQRDGVNPMHELECGRISQPQFLSALGGQLSDQLGRQINIDDFPEVWFSHLRPNHAMLTLMRRLRARGFHMGLLTNNVREWEPLWRPRLEIDDIFDIVVDSGFVGIRKPDPEIYAHTVQRISTVAERPIRPEEILFIDDVQENVEAARAAGWRAVQFVENKGALAAVDQALQLSEPSRSQQ